MHLESNADLSVEVFLSLTHHFFHRDGTPRPFRLREKRNTQDDPLDEHICAILDNDLRGDITVAGAPGPLVTPDMVIHRPALCNSTPKDSLRDDSTAIIGLEVKKLQRGSSGKIARPSGMDYNTTPPCGTMRIYDRRKAVLDVRGFYLFVCQEDVSEEDRTYQVTALVLCDGNMLNEDFAYYLSVVGQRSKEIGLGTFGDGANRLRPMLIFANPLGAQFLDYDSTLIHVSINLQTEHPSLYRAGSIERAIAGDADRGIRVFHCYHDRRNRGAAPESAVPFRHLDPFPTPNRSEATVPRGRFILDVCPSMQ
ncbi:MAG: hypothetical protein OXG27_02980 [Chloroflexi bacterium]|nr:hypothetical protein [Chloroflexota bacterium]